MRPTILLRGAAMLVLSCMIFYIASKFMTYEENLNQKKYSQAFADSKPQVLNCKMETSCPEGHFPFKITSGAANVIGPTICFNDQVLMSAIKNNVGKGLNIALVNEIESLLTFLKSINSGTILLLASFDDPATKMTDEARGLFTELGSSLIFSVNFRDNWIFLGAKPIKEKSPFEQILKNDKKKNKYENWPEAVEMEGCVPRRI
ncbi:protein FAM3C-like isoform X2 [Narcine bancroftii]|uniref:protein FAM3C-like isoform X2 n=1 Tax=Narcine bancroftii TaxID=1343680 RepID=UPI0038310601